MGKRTVTPDYAERILKEWNERNFRPYTEKVAEKYAQDMILGKWRYISGQTIKFTTDGWLIDGQHRLGAVVISGIAQPFNVEENYTEDDKYYIDQGNKRTLGNILGDLGYKYPNEISGAVRLGMDVRVWRAGSAGSPESGLRASFHQVLSLIEADNKIQFCMNSVYSVPRVLMPKTVGCYCYRCFHELDPDDAAVFFHKLVNVEECESPRDDAIAALHKRLAYGMWTARGRPLRLQQVATIIYAWNAWRKGESREQIKLAAYRAGNRLIIPDPV